MLLTDNSLLKIFVNANHILDNFFQKKPEQDYFLANKGEIGAVWELHQRY